MIVVADTSPLNYLLLFDEIHLLPAIFGQVASPTSRLSRTAASQNVTHCAPMDRWIAHLPTRVEVRSLASVADPALLALDAGEREAIHLALELGYNHRSDG